MLRPRGRGVAFVRAIFYCLQPLSFLLFLGWLCLPVARPVAAAVYWTSATSQDLAVRGLCLSADSGPPALPAVWGPQWFGPGRVACYVPRLSQLGFPGFLAHILGSSLLQRVLPQPLLPVKSSSFKVPSESDLTLWSLLLPPSWKPLSHFSHSLLILPGIYYILS